MTSSSNPSVFGQPVTFTATVTGSRGTPTGTVTFQDGGTSIGTGVLNGNSTDTATFAAPSTVINQVSTHTITAVYGSDGAFLSSTSLPFNQTVGKASTTTTVTGSSPASPLFGQPVTFTATVTAVSGTFDNGGTVTFKDNGTSMGTGLVSSGTATYTTGATQLPGGTDIITAAYSGDANFNASAPSANYLQTVGQASTTTTVTSSLNTSVFGQPVTFTATVTGSNFDNGGTVTFQDNGTSIGTGLVSSGMATYTTGATQLPAGTDIITAVYGSDTNFSGSTGTLAGGQTVNQASTTTTVTSSGSGTSVYGESVTFTATVTNSSSGSSATPTGTVTFQDNSISIGTCTVSNGTATYTPSAVQLPVGTDTITAVYGNDTNFAGSTGTLAGDQTVTPADTTTSVTYPGYVYPGSLLHGQSVTFTATVSAAAPSTGTPTGTVTFSDDNGTLGTGTLSAGQATLTWSFTVQGSYNITATYVSDSNNFAGSDSTTMLLPLYFNVNKALVTTTVASSANSSVFGQNVTLTATVSASSPATGIPTGTVTFKEGASVLGTATLASGQATYTNASFPVATHTITASYSGDTNFNGPATRSFTQTVQKSSSSTALTSSSANPIAFGSAVTFTATVSYVSPGNGTPTGTVTFSDGSNSLGTASLSGTTPDTATFTTTQLATGTHTIKAVYSSDANFSASTSTTLTQTVTAMSTTTTVTSAPNTSVFGQSVTFTATVAAVSGTFDDGGTVTFSDGSTPLGTCTLNSSGQATFTALSSVITTVATHTITVSYSGDTNFAASSGSVLQTVNQASTTTTISSPSSNPSVFGQSVTFTATVAASGAGVGTPTGVVTFEDAGTSIGTGSLSGGTTDTATFTTSTLVVSTSHAITAVYNGDNNFITSSSTNTVPQTVNQASTTTTVTNAVNPSVFGQSVTFTATVAAFGPARACRGGRSTSWTAWATTWGRPRCPAARQP